MTRHIGTVVADSDSPFRLRTARVNRTEKQGVVGVGVFLSPEELEKRGIDPEEADEIAIRVEEGFVLLDHKQSDS